MGNYWIHIWVARGSRRENSQTVCIYSPCSVLSRSRTLETIWSIMSSPMFSNKFPTDLVQPSSRSRLIRCHLIQLWEIITFISPDYLRFLQNLELYLGLSPESRNLFLGLSWHKPCLAIPDEASLVRLKKVLLEVSFLIDKRVRLESLPLLRAQYKKIALPKHGYF